MQRKMSLPMRSSAAIVGFSDDLLMEILVRLPAKSLIRFQLVSKHWHYLILNPSFLHLHHSHHLRRSSEQLSFLLRTFTSQYFICNLTTKSLVPFRFGFPDVKVLQSCNGLLLLKCRTALHGQPGYYIFNPTTMKSRNLHLRTTSYGLCLMFDPSKSLHYRVFCFRSVNSSTRYRVYDSKTHRWNDGGKPHNGPYKFWDGVYWKGGLYFCRSRQKSSCCFFPEDDVHPIPHPPRIQSRRARRSYVMESHGHMHYIVLSLRPEKNRLFILEMNDDESGWFMKYLVDLNPISDAFAAQGTAVDLLGMIRGEKEEDSFVLFHVPGKLMIYRFSDEVFEVLVDFRRENYFPEQPLQYDFRDGHRFIECLAPV